MAGSLQIKLEYITITDGDEGVFWHLRQDVPTYIDRISKENYAIGASQDDFIDHLFAILGVTELSLKAYRIYIMKSPVYGWEEVNGALEQYLLAYFNKDHAVYVGGSAEKNGRGTKLDSNTYRRDI